MSEQIIVPALGESITEATVAKWLKNVGDADEADEPVVELETDKVNLEVPSPISGTVGDIKFKDGDTVEVGAILGSIQNNGEATEKKPVEKHEQPKEQKKNNVVELEPEKKQVKVYEQKKAEETVVNENIISEENEEEPLVLTNEVEKKVSKNIKKRENNLSPSVRKIVAEKKIDLNKIKGTGRDGRILKGDLIDLMSIKPSPSERKIKFGEEEKIKMTRLRQTIAKRLKQAQDNAALLTTFNEVDMSGIIEMRKENQDDFQKRYGVNLDKGLVVPVLKNADELSFADIEKNIKSMSEKAREGKLNIEDLQGGTFTISNGGVYGSMLSTPILNLPQSAVLGMHNIVDRPFVVDGEIKIRPLMYLALSYDHRIIDGKDSVSFLKTIKENLEDPRRLFLEI